jgi:hypothetical protein
MELVRRAASHAFRGTNGNVVLHSPPLTHAGGTKCVKWGSSSIWWQHERSGPLNGALIAEYGCSIGM